MAYVTKGELAAEFWDTMRFCDEHPLLREAVESTNTRTRVYTEYFAEEVQAKKGGKTRVESGRTLQKAITLSKEFPGRRIAVLNFAASGTPGGGVKHGSYAQEESLCRCSTLYPSLKSAIAWEGFYSYHQNNCGWAASDRCIYSPEVVVCRDDEDLLSIDFGLKSS